MLNTRATRPAGESKTYDVRQMFREVAGRCSEGVAIRSGEIRMTYSELDRASDRVAASLRERGATRGTTVAILSEKPEDVICGLLGALKAGALFVPLDPRTPPRRLEAILEVVAPAALVLGEGTDLATAGAGAPPVLRMMGGMPAGGDGAVSPSSEMEDLGPDDPCYLYFTSGSTGKPKAIAGRFKSIAHFIRWEIETLGVEEGWRVSQLISPSFDAFLRDVFVPLCAGGTVCIPPDRDTVADSRRLLAWLAEEEIQLVHCVPSLFRTLLYVDPRPLPALRYVLLSGEPLLPADVRRWTERQGTSTRLVNLYGPSETTMTKLVHFVEPTDGERRTIPVGKPMPGARALVLDPHGKACPPRAVGEIYIRTPYRSLGYYGQPELTAEVFVRNPFTQDPDDLIYRTGDLGRVLDDGSFEFLGRRDNQVKIRGVRIELPEIENLLLSHPRIRETVVVDLEDPNGTRFLCAYVVLDDPDGPAGLRDFLAESLPEHSLPSVFVALDELPRTLSGKVDRRALPSPERVRETTDWTLDLPRSSTEEIVASLFSQVLGLGRVGIHESFFELGGHSLLATQVLARVRSAFDVEVPLRALFSHPTVAGLTRQVDEALRGPQRSTPPLVRVLRDQPLPLSFAQQRLWFLDQLQPGSPVYHMPVALLLKGALSVPALEASLREVVRRHESLRTTFVEIEGSPFQKIGLPTSVPLEVIDLGGLGARQRDGELARLVMEHARLPFDLAAGPLLRSTLVRQGEGEHAMLLNQHHIVSDGWSTEVLVREVVTLYGAFAAGRPSPLPELAIQYPDVAVWQRSWLAGEVLEGQVGYWRDRLAGLPALLELPTDRPRPPFRSGRGASHAFRLPAETLRGLKSLGQREEVTEFMTMLALFQAFLSRLAGQEDLAVGTVVANRDRSELEPLIGSFANTLVMRGDLSGRPSVRDLLVRTRESAMGAYTFQDLPFEYLVEALHPVRATSYTPLFQAMLVLQNVPEKSLALPGLQAIWIEEGTQTGAARFDLTLDLKESLSGLTGVFEYAADLFDRTTIERWSAGFGHLLAAALAAPEARPAELPLLAAAERQQMVLEWNDTAVVRQRVAGRIHELVERQADRRPQAPAVAGQGGSLSYAALETRANRLAHRLRRLGVGPESRVALCVERSPEMVVALLGILKAGGAYVPLDPSHPTERLKLVLGDSAPEVLVTEERWLERLGSAAPRAICLDRDRALIDAEEPSRLDTPLGGSPESLAYVLYTSGSTGRPKGVCLPHGAVVNFLYAMAERLGLGEEAVVPALTTLTFDIAALEIYLPLALGGRVEVIEGEEAADGHQLALRMAAAGVTAMQATPATWRLLLDSGWDGRRGLKAICGGEALPWDLAAALQARGVELWNVYGPTETAVWSSAGAVAAEPGTGASVGLGQPVANTRFHVVDRELALVPIGVAGELWIGGAGVARGYWRRPELTAERFIPDPWSAAGGSRLYRTGDLVRHRPDGELEFLGRIDHQIKLRGFRIELGEIEAALLRHPRVLQAAVVPVSGGTDRRLVACFASPEGLAPAGAELRDLLRERLPAYMVPTAFLSLAEIPLTPSGKIDRRALAQLASDAPVSGLEWRAPRTPLEEIMARLWSDLLRLPQVGADDNFFQLGGHSLNGVQVVSRLRQAFQIDLPLRALFESPTVAGLAAEVERRRRPDGAPARPGISSWRQDRSAPPPLSFGQERFWNGRQREACSVPSTIPILVELAGDLDLSCLRHALRGIVDRHEVLRTSFQSSPVGPVQIVHPALPARLPLVDLERLSPLDQRVECQRWSIQDGRSPFDYERGPLFRTTLFRCSARKHVMLFTIHHVAFDGWSESILTQELSVLYNAFLEGRPSPLPPLAAHYQDFARWQRQTFAEEALAEQVTFWREHLRGAVPVDLRGDRPRPAQRTFAAGIEDFTIPEALEKRLEAFAAEQCATLFMMLLAAFKALLRHASGQDDVVVTCMFANRDQAEIENLIGYFSAGLPLRTSGAHTFRDLLEQVRAVTLAAHEHPYILYERALDGASFLEPGDRGGITSFRVMFQLAKIPAGGEQALPDLQVTRLPLDTGRIGQDLTLFLVQSHRLAGRFRYNRDVLDPERMIRLRERFLAILEAAVADPDQPLEELASPNPGSRRAALAMPESENVALS
jgi:amino acid adenylation domain-containing protein